MGNSYFKKDYTKGELNAVEITQGRLQKVMRNVAMASFYCLVIKIWKQLYLCCYKKGKNAWFELCAPKIYEMFVYKHTETIEYVKK